MSSCPDLAALEARPRTEHLASHVAGCEACRLVADAIDERGDHSCERFDALLAAREDGTLGPAGENLLARHLASCAACRAVAASISPTADADGDHADLPSVDPASYALGLEIARGGMGRILAARDLRVGRPVAVKELLGNTPQLAARFEREARVTARLQHPGIVPIYEIGRWPDGTPFYAMRMVEGITLREAIERAPSPAARLGLVPQVLAAAEAVAFAHAQRVIHRDLTPSNVLLGAYGETVVIDWGLAKDLSAGTGDTDDGEDPYRSAPPSITSVGAVIGTAAYMPPEQAHAVPVDERADVYALGAILFHVLAGIPPYRAPSTRELLRAVKAGPPPRIDDLAPHAPRDLVSIVTKAMARDPNDRYPTARELSEELARFQTGRMVEAHAYSGSERVRRFVRRHRVAVVTLVFALALVTAIGGLSISRVLRSHAETHAQITMLLEERGRMELLAGSPMRALAYLEAAFRRDADTPSLQFMLASAMRDLDAAERDLDCGGDVRWFALSPDGRDVIATCHDAARVWELASGSLRATLGPFPGGFSEAVYSHDGRTIATWGYDGKVRLWDAHTGVSLRTLAHGAALTVVSFSADDRRLVSLGRDGVAIAWTVEGTQLQRIVANRNPFASAVWGALSLDGTRVLTMSIFGEGRGWDVATGALLGSFEHGTLVIGAELSLDGERAATCGFDRLAKVWNTRTGELMRQLGGHTDVPWKCVFSRDGALLLTTGHDGRAIVWDLATGAQITSVIHDDVLTAAAFSADGRRFVTIGIGGRVVVWDTRSGAMLVNYDTLGGKHARFSLDGTRLLTERGDGRLRIWRRAAGPLLGGHAPAHGARVVGVLPDGGRVVSEGADGAVQLWDTQARRPLAHAAIHVPVSVADGVVAATTWDAVLILDAATGTTRTRIARRMRPKALSVGAAGVAIVDADGGEVFDAAGQLRMRLPSVAGARLDPRRPRMVTWTSNAELTLWDTSSGEAVATLGNGRVVDIGDAILVVDGEPNTLRMATLWDPSTGARIEAELEPTRIVPTLDVSGTYLTTIGVDQVVTVVRARDGQIASSFVAQGLLHAEVDPSGVLVAGIAAHGTSAVVLRATDGRMLARWPIEHAPPVVGEASFRPAEGSARWRLDGARIVTSSTSVDVWDATREVRRDRLAAIVREQLPWRLKNGTLVWVKGRILGRVTRGGAPVAGVHVVARIRTPPELEGVTISWESTRPRMREAVTTTRADGTFELLQLYPGEYRLGVQGTPLDERVHVSVDDANVELALP
ncbi:MAG: protein kinase [Kofleriaceae bacterium]|nr:protein kinase [Kofleriaceae bacterium]